MPQVIGIGGGTLGAREAYANAMADTQIPDDEDLVPYSVFEGIIDLASRSGLVWHLDSGLPVGSYLLSRKNTLSALVSIKIDGVVILETELEERSSLTQHQKKLHLERIQATSLKLANLISEYGLKDIVTPSTGIPEREFVGILTDLGKYQAPSRIDLFKAFLEARTHIGPPTPSRADRLDWFFEGKRKLRLQSSLAALKRRREERQFEGTGNRDHARDQLEYASGFNSSALDQSRDFVATSVLLIALVATRNLDYLRDRGSSSSGIWSFLYEAVHLVVREFDDYRGAKNPIEDIGGLFKRAKSAASARLARFDSGTEDDESVY